MANLEHLKILKRGVGVWNQWRNSNPRVVPDPDGAKLTFADLEDVEILYPVEFISTSFGQVILYRPER